MKLSIIPSDTHLEHGGLRRPELDEGRLARGHLDDGAAERPDVGGGAVPALALVDHLRGHVLRRTKIVCEIWSLQDMLKHELAFSEASLKFITLYYIEHVRRGRM